MSPSRIRQQYEAWPYPKISMFAAVREQDTWQLNHAFLADRCCVAAASRPQIWIAGCGTMQPYTFALANPDAEILASDLSKHSLRIARRRCLWHGVRLPEFAAIDLCDERSWPAGPFDQIECYGVLMNLPEPGAVLRRLAGRLTPNGMLRIMVYPHYGRRRVFQIQRVARLLSLTLADRTAPARLRDLLLALPKRHPLRYAFTHYADARNDNGIVDGFLHAGDRGFTGLQLASLVHDAGLRFAWLVHRDFGQPNRMAAPLGLAGIGPGGVLNYLDLWQELRSNFVACLVRADQSAAGIDTRPRLHPALTTTQPGIPLRRRLKRRLQAWTGVVLPDRTGDPIRVPAAELRRLRRQPVDNGLLAQHGVVLTGTRTADNDTVDQPWLGEDAFLEQRYDTSPIAVNPFYQHLFDAYRYSALRPELGLGCLQTQIDRWQPHAEALEDDGGFGLTPIATFHVHRDRLLAYERDMLHRPTVDSLTNVRYALEDDGIRQLRAFLSPRLSLPDLRPEEWRELWLLLGSHESLFLQTR